MGAATVLACVAALCGADALSPWFAAVREPPADRPLHVLQLGDSHTAGDAITGAWRSSLQAQLGDGGRGMLPPGRPYAGFRLQGMTATPSVGWTVKGVFGAVSAETPASPRPPIGLAGYTLVSNTAGATLDLTADPDHGFETVQFCAVAGPYGGKISILLGTLAREFDLAAAADEPVCYRVDADEPRLAARLMVMNGQARITSWGVMRKSGVMLSNLGVPGAQLVHWERADDRVMAAELKAWAPDLLVVAFGTNEGFSPRLDTAVYTASLTAALTRLRRLAGNVPMLVVGAPDAATRNRGLSANADGPAVDCNERIDNSPAAAVLIATDAAMAAAAAMAVDAPLLIDPPATDILTLPATAEPLGNKVMVRTGQALFVPPGLGVVRGVQRRVAASLGMAFWDWQGRMGGACSAVPSVQARPARMRGDFVHHTTAGGAATAGWLVADLDAAASSR